MRFYFKIFSILISINNTILYAASLNDESINSNSIKSDFSISNISYKRKNSNNFDNRKISSISSSSTSCSTVQSVSNIVVRSKLFKKAAYYNKKIIQCAINIYYKLDDYQREDYCISEELQKNISNEINDLNENYYIFERIIDVIDLLNELKNSNLSKEYISNLNGIIGICSNLVSQQTNKNIIQNKQEISRIIQLLTNVNKYNNIKLFVSDIENINPNIPNENVSDNLNKLEQLLINDFCKLSSSKLKSINNLNDKIIIDHDTSSDVDDDIDMWESNSDNYSSDDGDGKKIKRKHFNYHERFCNKCLNKYVIKKLLDIYNEYNNIANKYKLTNK